MGDDTTIDDLKERVALLEALVGRLTTEAGAPEQPSLPPEVVAPTERPDAGAGGAALPRRHLLGKAGVAAVGAVLGGTIAAVGSASPASAATGSFDTSTSAPALTATSTGTGPAISAAATGGEPALTTSGSTRLDGALKVTANGQAVTINANGTSDALGLVISSERTGAFIVAKDRGLWANGDLAVEATGEKLGVLAAGSNAQILLAGGPHAMASPPTRNDSHQKGELYFDDPGVLWVCTADGTPGTWSRLGGTGTAGAFTVLRTPVRVYDTRPTSTRPGGGTGPVTGTRHGIDLTANSSGLPTDATAATVTLTVLNTQAQNSAYGQIYADALTTAPSTSVVNWSTANQLIATTTTSALTAGKVAISMNPGANVLIDVLGYWR